MTNYDRFKWAYMVIAGEELPEDLTKDEFDEVIALSKRLKCPSCGR